MATKKRVISAEDLEKYPELKEANMEVGDTILVPTENPEGSIQGWTLPTEEK